MLLRVSMALLCAAAFAPLPASADAVPDAAQKAIASGYQLNCTATQDPTDANLNAAFALLAPDFVHVDFKGKQTTRDEFVAQGKQQIKQLHVTSCNNTAQSITLSDASTVVVVDASKFAGQLQAPDGNHDIDVDHELAGHLETGERHVAANAEQGRQRSREDRRQSRPRRRQLTR